MPETEPHLRYQRQTPGGRAVLHVSFGNLLELAGAGLACYAIYRLVGLSWSLVGGAVMLLVAAELVYDVSVLHFPLPRRPRPVERVRRRLSHRRGQRL